MKQHPATEHQRRSLAPWQEQLRRFREPVDTTLEPMQTAHYRAWTLELRLDRARELLEQAEEEQDPEALVQMKEVLEWRDRPWGVCDCTWVPCVCGFEDEPL